MAARATLRASDADRDAVAERLRRAAVEGRLEPDELEQRLHAALRARTYRELDRLVADLPSGEIRRLEPRRIAYGARSALALALPIVVALMAVAAFVAVLAIAAAGWFVWMLIWLLVCTTRSTRCRHRRMRPVGSDAAWRHFAASSRSSSAWRT